MPRVSVIVPIYNVEAYIECCVHSLLKQTLEGIEYIFVDDCSPDNSLVILEKILQNHPKLSNEKNTVKVLHHDINKGLPSARNTGLKVATGEYIIHCDSDDWIEPKMYELLYNVAIANDADLVWCNYDTTKDPVQEYSPDTKVSLSGVDYIKLLCLGKYHGFVWNKLVRRDIIINHEIISPAGHNMMEDVVVTVRMLYYATKILNVPQVLYHYIQNNNSLTRMPNYNDVIINISNVSLFLTEKFRNNVDMLKHLRWYQQRLKFEIISQNCISITEFNDLWSYSLDGNSVFNNPTLKWYDKIVYWGLNYKMAFFLSLRNFIRAIVKR